MAGVSPYRVLGWATGLLTLCCLATVWAGDDDQAKQWLQRMLHASQTLSYHGTFVYIQGQDVEVMNIAHSGEAQSKRQRMVTLTGAMREVVVAENSVMCLLPQQQVAFRQLSHDRSPFPISLPHELDALEAHYRFTMFGDDRVAGLKTRIVAIQARDQLRYSYRLWLEHDSGMVLRSALVDTDGAVLEQLLFTDIEIGPIDPTLLMPQYLNPASAAQLVEADKNSAVSQSAWTVSEPPPGFRRISHTRSADKSAHPTEHMVFSDGLATVSVFLEYLGGAEPLLSGPSRMATMNAFGAVLGDYQVISIGEVPAATVQRIATSITHNAD